MAINNIQLQINLTNGATRLAPPPGESQDAISLESVISEWILSPSDHQDQAKKPQEIILNQRVIGLYRKLEALIKSEGAKARFEDDLFAFLENKESLYEIDDCVRWSLLVSACGTEDIDKDDEFLDGSPNILLARVLLKIKPVLAFQTSEKESVPGRFSELPLQPHGTPKLAATDGKAMPRRFSTDLGRNGRNTEMPNPVFTWECPHPSHRKAIEQKFLVLYTSNSSPIFLAIRLGIAPVVDYAISFAEKYAQDHQNDPNSPSLNMKKHISKALTAEDKPDGISALGAIIRFYGMYDEDEDEELADLPSGDDRKSTPKGPSIRQKHFLRIIERLLTFDPKLAKDDKSFKKAMENGLFVVVEKILSLEPESFLEDKTILEILKKPQFVLPKPIIVKAGRSLSVAKGVIERDLRNTWANDDFQTGLETLVGSEKERRSLMYAAFELRKPWFVERILELSPNALDVDAARQVIKLGLWDIWNTDAVKAAWKTLKDQNSELDFLPDAVQNQSCDFVESFVREDPDSVSRRALVSATSESKDVNDDDREKYPLWHNNFAIVGGSIQPRQPSLSNLQIRKILVGACIRFIDNMQELSEIFQDSEQSVAQLNFDLSLFNSKCFPFDQFVHCLTLHGPSKSLTYEPTIRYCDFPELDPNAEDCRGDMYREHREVFQILDWLQRTHNVEEIVKVRVPDRMYNPHNELEIARYVDSLKVTFLDWRCLDLAISIFSEDTKRRMRVLHLYSSGKRAVVSHWLSKEVNDSLRSLETLEIHITEDLMNKARCEELKKFIKIAFVDIQKWRPTLECKVNIQRWDTQKVPAARSLAQIAEKAVPKLWPFIELYQPHLENQKMLGTPWQPTKIAIIDNGIMHVAPVNDATHDNSKQLSREPRMAGFTDQRPGSANSEEQRKAWGLWPRVETGRSFVDENYRIGSWSFASDPHGTQMANLICSIDPHCRLYVAKVTEGRYEVAASRITKAIKWAINEKVDIISMSLAISESNSGLREAVTKADQAGILMLCSTHDEGLNLEEAYPAGWGETVTIGAAEEGGGPTQRTPPKGYDFRFHATKISAGAVPFIQSEETVSGSSVANAIAAGLSSLIISCHRLVHQNNQHINNTKWRKDLVERKLKEMTVDRDQKYVQLDKFCDLQKRLLNGEDLNIKDIIDKGF